MLLPFDRIDGNFSIKYIEYDSKRTKLDCIKKTTFAVLFEQCKFQF